MRAPVSWLAEFVELPADLSPREVGEALVRVGLEIEKVDSASEGVSGPIVVGRIVSFDDEPQKNGKVIRWCQVDVGVDHPRGIVCGAHNFSVDDLVVTALPGATLAGGFEITARKTYGHISDGMISSARELGMGDEHAGILVLAPGSAEPGDDAVDALSLREAVLDMSVTPDRGYCLSMRGLAREASTALDVAFHDIELPLPPVDGRAYEVTVEDPVGCDQFSARAVAGLQPGASTPGWMARRLRQAGMRPISLPVDIANYVMLETGQPLHTFDRAKLNGPIGVRRALAGEKLTTLDGAVRDLDPDDLVVTDDSGPIALAGVMGGASTDIDAGTTDIVLEAAHWDPACVARAVRRHKLPSEASKRFERGVDPAMAGVALQRCVDLLSDHGGVTSVDGFTVVGSGPAPRLIALLGTRPGAVAGMPIDRNAVLARLMAIGCTVDGGEALQVRPPTWRPDLTDPADLVEEVVRLEGYHRIPSVLPTPPPGRGLTELQRVRRAISRVLATSGYAEVLCYPFVSSAMHDACGLAPDDPRRQAVRLANPLSDTEPELRTSLLPGLLTTLNRNVGRGSRDLALFETGLVFLARPHAPKPSRPGVDRRPSDAELAALDAALPDQPWHAAAVLCGQFERQGWWGPGRRADWSDALEAARAVAAAARREIEVRPADLRPWHPGRCAGLWFEGALVGHAGELHPRVTAALDLPEGTCAMEMNIDLITPAPPAMAPHLSGYPPVLLDIALVVAESVPSADVLTAIKEGAGELLESVRLFDVYRDAVRLGLGVKSLAFSMRFRAPDRTLTLEEASAARDAALARAAVRVGAQLRG
ncbi:MAG: phenylalanine--tRNA ligase subunit beta [Actinomycetota bacterium]|nr:phenylalanine--tRNA ligase subunit beta [Actinomycetota bacterium]